MCIAPNTIYRTGIETKPVNVPCRKCWACIADRTNDLIGRCLCEAGHSDAVWHVTFTYDDKKLDDPSQARIVRKSDFQKFVKHMRRSVKMRYLVVSETGKKNSKRVHFHAILFFRGKLPQWEHNKREWIKEWPWGHIFVDPIATEHSMRYVLKYAMKDVQNDGAWLSYSRIPIMGIDHAVYYGKRYAAEKLIPRNFKYRPPNAHEGRTYEFRGESRFILLDKFFQDWPEALGKPMSENMANSVTAWIKSRQRKAFEKLCPTHQSFLQMNNMRLGAPKLLTDYQKFEYLNEGYLLHIEENYGKAARDYHENI